MDGARAFFAPAAVPGEALRPPDVFFLVSGAAFLAAFGLDVPGFCGRLVFFEEVEEPDETCFDPFLVFITELPPSSGFLDFIFLWR